MPMGIKITYWLNIYFQYNAETSVDSHTTGAYANTVQPAGRESADRDRGHSTILSTPQRSLDTPMRRSTQEEVDEGTCASSPAKAAPRVQSGTVSAARQDGE